MNGSSYNPGYINGSDNDFSSQKSRQGKNQFLPEISGSKKGILDISDRPPDKLTTTDYRKKGKSPYLATSKRGFGGIDVAQEVFRDAALVQQKLQT